MPGLAARIYSLGIPSGSRGRAVSDIGSGSIQLWPLIIANNMILFEQFLRILLAIMEAYEIGAGTN